MYSNSFKAQQCLRATNGDRDLPSFVRPEGNGEPRFKAESLQAIITSYRFNCCGVVTQWRAFVYNSNNGHRDVYDISFQVWKPMPLSLGGSDGCYNLTGFNQFSPISLANPGTADIGIVTGEPLASERIEVQPGDVVGFYLRNIANHKNDGIQFARDTSLYTDETVWFATGSLTPRSDTACMYPVGTSGLLRSSTNLAPLISVSICKS